MVILDKALLQKFGSILLEWSNKPNAILQLKRSGGKTWFDVSHINELSLNDFLRIKPDPVYRSFLYEHDKNFLSQLIGRKVFHKKFRNIERIQFYGDVGVIFNNKLSIVSYEELLENYLFEDEKPCGVLF